MGSFKHLRLGQITFLLMMIIYALCLFCWPAQTSQKVANSTCDTGYSVYNFSCNFHEMYLCLHINSIFIRYIIVTNLALWLNSLTY